MSRRWFIGLSATIGIVLLAVTLAVALVDSSEPETAQIAVSGSEESDELPRLELTYGLGRLPITRSVLLDLCPDDGASDFPECREADGDAVAERPRPEITSAGVAADISRTDDGAQFPAGQIAVSATNQGPTGLRINVTADPREPERVPAGDYEGEIVVERANGPPVHFDVIAALEPRASAHSRRAFGYLLAGALAGALVKWLNDVFAPLSALRRRHRRLNRTMRTDLPYLPLVVTRSLEDLREAIREADSDRVAESLDLIHENSTALSEFAASIKALYLELDKQRSIIGENPTPVLETFLQRQEAQIYSLRARAWPWKDGSALQSELAEAQESFKAATDALLQNSPRHEFEAAVRGLVAPDTRLQAALEADREAVDRAAERERLSSPGRNPFEWLLDNAWWVLLIVAAIVVALVGYQTEYVENDAYQGDATDLLKLVAWGFTLQLAGTTAVEVSGRLLTHGRSTTA